MMDEIGCAQAPSQEIDQETVGYRCPPRSGQFKKGQSGNPGGRPRKPRNGKLGDMVAGAVIEALKKRQRISRNGKVETVTTLEALIERLKIAAMQGDMKAMGILLSQVKMYNLAKEFANDPIVICDDPIEAARQYAEWVMRS